MLQHHNEEEHAPVLGLTLTPGQSQVTPQELAQAIVSIETRQRTDAPMRTKTITLEDTIRQLELTVTPEELLMELHTQRTAAHQQAVMTPPRNKRSVSWWLLLTGCVLSTAITICVCFWAFQMAVHTQKLSNAYSELQTSYSKSQELNKMLGRVLDRLEPHHPKGQSSLHK